MKIRPKQWPMYSKPIPLTKSSSCITLRGLSGTRSTIYSGAFARTTPDRSTASSWIAPAESLRTPRRRGDNRASTDAADTAGRLLRSRPRLREDRRRSPVQDRLGPSLFGAG